MVHSDGSPFDPDPVKIVHGPNGAPLVFVAEETESPGPPGLLVPHQMDADDLAILRKHTEDTPLRQPVREATQEDPGAVSVLGAPGPCQGRGRAELGLAVVQLGCSAHGSA